MSIALAARSKSWVCGHSLAGIVGSNPAGATVVCCECCLFSGRVLLRRADHSSRGVLLSVLCLSVIMNRR